MLALITHQFHVHAYISEPEDFGSYHPHTAGCLKKTLPHCKTSLHILILHLTWAVFKKKTHLAGIDEIRIHLAQSENWGCFKTKKQP